jgi:hypothetical protein
MEALKFNITVKSDTLKIPELKKFIGKKIEVILLDNSNEEIIRTDKFKKLKDLKGKIHFDEDAFTELRQNSIL